MTLGPFANEPVLELRRSAVRERLATALAQVDASLPLEVPVWIGEEPGAAAGIDSTDPGAPDRLVARAGVAGAADVDRAVELAAEARHEWEARGAQARAEVLVAAAALMREDRLALAALAVRECAKPWPEADADVCEAIDFLEYYARAAVELDSGCELVQVPGERNTMHYRARGVVAVIAPWNFPLVIPLGMTAAALATGNAALLKPAEQSPGCALRIVEALRAAGVPPGVLALLPG
ncbi:MAG: aldehyde dehydrogenase family protein, partial [Thermoleophilaceae bacterium]|nr:aldehyde dehydrogenase family protein [Thermoleophilaceae bacterium]